jgi:triosephosphate isomerase
MKVVACNWKMYLARTEALKLAEKLKDFQTDKVILFPSLLHLHEVGGILGKSKVALGAQNCSAFPEGGYTGGISAKQLAEYNCKYVIIGHSERRMYFAEGPEVIGQKIMQAQASGLKVILCVGEPLDVHQDKQSLEYIINQLRACLPHHIDTHDIILAYEPVWAIGTGVTPAASDIESVLRNIKSTMHWKGKLWYGGSVSAANINWLKEIKVLDGFLIGAASTRYEEISKIIESTSSL